MTPIKARIGIALLALVGSVAATGAASAGTWHLNAAACPDLREDRIDSRYTENRYDLREDRRDQSVIECPPRAWSYEPDRHERDRRYLTIAAQPASPGIVYVARNGGYYVRGYRGETRWIDVQVHYARDYRGRRFGPELYGRPGGRHDDRRGPSRGRGHGSRY
jgi:hypothetical protein